MLKIAESAGTLSVPLALCGLLLGTLAYGEVETRTTNNGNVILEAVPEVPQEIVEALNRFQNVRSATFQDWSEDGESIYIRTRFGTRRSSITSRCREGRGDSSPSCPNRWAAPRGGPRALRCSSEWTREEESSISCFCWIPSREIPGV